MHRLSSAAAAALAVVALGGATAATATPGATTSTAGVVADRHGHGKPQRDGDVARAIAQVTRSTAWTQTGTLRLGFDTFHPQGLVVTKDRIFLSSVEIIEPTQKYPAPVDGMDRTAGKGRGHLFVMDRSGRLLKDVVLGEGDSYHPGGIDSDGRNIWVSVSEYRPNSHAIVYTVDQRTLTPQKMFEVDDHVGGIVLDRTTGHLVGNTWGSRRFYEWTVKGKQLDTWLNESHFIDYQDCAYAERGKALCTGVTVFAAQPGSTKPYELGGMALLDLRSHAILHEAPMQMWSTAGHVATRNPVHVDARGGHVTVYAAPDDHGEGNDTEILTFEADVPVTR